MLLMKKRDTMEHTVRANPNLRYTIRHTVY
ncbi:hypothetical protein N7519_008611 [Penicillium mononematosum]|nr:uncharacterized protein N7519_008611 [Penicillium mononematosum]KAJ6178150.1 hypothetical protein N7519_008611 [Penicillium mononematosum]